jgi:hypothetical protein
MTRPNDTAQPLSGYMIRKQAKGRFWEVLDPAGWRRDADRAGPPRGARWSTCPRRCRPPIQ